MNERNAQDAAHKTPLSQLISHYDAFIVDIWGVVHDGGKAFPWVMACLEHIRKTQKPLVFLTNSPRKSEHVVATLERKGLNSSLYDRVISSGDLFFEDLTNKKLFSDSVNQVRAYLVDDESEITTEKNALTIVDLLPNADYLAVFTIKKEEENFKRYLPLLEQARVLNIPVVCVNADIFAYTGGKKYLRPGYLAKYYMENLGGEAIIYGKPEKRNFEKALEVINTIKPSEKVLVIGDSIRTDIKGAIASGLDSALVIGNRDWDSLEKTLAPQSRPTYIIDAFRI